MTYMNRWFNQDYGAWRKMVKPSTDCIESHQTRDSQAALKSSAARKRGLTNLKASISGW